jgi:hypothetical protein
MQRLSAYLRQKGFKGNNWFAWHDRDIDEFVSEIKDLLDGSVTLKMFSDEKSEAVFIGRYSGKDVSEVPTTEERKDKEDYRKIKPWVEDSERNAAVLARNKYRGNFRELEQIDEAKLRHSSEPSVVDSAGDDLNQ